MDGKLFPITLNRFCTRRANELLLACVGGVRRFVVAFALVSLSVSWSGSASAAQSNSCKQCSDDRRACLTGYSGKTCQIAYERCMKTCKQK